MLRRPLLLALVAVTAALATAAPASAVAPPTVQPVQLPRDHVAHPGFGMEWWYSAGRVKDDAGHSYSYFATIWSTPRYVLAHVNLIDLKTGTTVVSQDQIGSALPRVAADPLTVAAGGISYRWRRSGALGRFVVRAQTRTGSLRLSLRPQRAYTLHGTRGVIQQGDGGPSAYYSATRLAVRATWVDGATTTPLAGEGWFDHQWGNFASTPAAMRWDWFACRLSDGRDLMLYRFLTTQNQPLTARFVGTLVGRTGKVRHLKSFRVDELAPIVARPDLGANYPLGWRLRVPQVGLDLTLETLSTNQFIKIIGAGTIWEGAAKTIRGPAGLCYVEDSRTLGAQ
jgi:predicted secreted hydrolase